MNKTIKYPVGIQSFEKIREDNFIYVDKTEIIYNLVSDGSYYFLSRPRRFGKSLLLSTIKAYFEGRRDLFEGLALDSLTEKWDRHPVLYLDLNNGEYNSTDGLRAVLESHLRDWEHRFEAPLEDDERNLPPNLRFARIIRKASEKCGRNVVILVDEYDKPMLGAIGNEPLAEDFRSMLKAFYSNLKTMDAHIKFAMLTGVAKFSKVSIFSDLNNLNDISLNHAYSSICGITNPEIDQYFQSGISGLASHYGVSPEEIREELRQRYDGYHFSQYAEDVYNPFSLVSVFANMQLASYWFETGTPTFLVKLLQRKNWRLTELSPSSIAESELRSAGIFSDKPLPVLYQTGYLTIKGYNPTFSKYILGFPNREVKEGFLDFLIPYYLQRPDSHSDFDLQRFVEAVEAGDIELFMSLLKSTFAGMPYSEKGFPEARFQDAVYLIFTMMGFYTRMEERTSNGRIDILVETSRYIYIFEFKTDSTVAEAIGQIREKKYWLPYVHSGKAIYLVGANFNTQSRCLDDIAIEKPILRHDQ